MFNNSKINFKLLFLLGLILIDGFFAGMYFIQGNGFLCTFNVFLAILWVIFVYQEYDNTI